MSISTQRSLPHPNRILVLLALALFIPTSARATDLSGKVTEVIDGNTISLKSLSHTIKVRLLAVMPPEKSQPYADVARKHLADLILGKYVVVRYTGIGQEGYLVGRILLEQVDVNAQMLRDGVAWYYRPDESDLAEADRQIYPTCEQAARTESRGLWSEADPMPPWEFRRKQLEAAHTVAITTRPPSGRPTMGLETAISTPSSVISSYAGPAIPLSRIADKPEESRNANVEWTRFRLLTPSGSILVPTTGVRNSASMPLSDGRMGEFSWYMVRSNKTAYVVMSSTATLPQDRFDSSSHSNETVLNSTIQGFIAGIRSDYQSQGVNFSCEPTAVRDFFVWDGYYTGREYSLAGCSIPGTVRVYVRGMDRTRSLQLVAAFNLDGKEDAHVKNFFQSLILGPARLPYTPVDPRTPKP